MQQMAWACQSNAFHGISWCSTTKILETWSRSIRYGAIRFFTGKIFRPSKIHHQIIEASGDNTIIVRHVRKWCRDFKMAERRSMIMIALVGPGHRLRKGVLNWGNRRVSIRYFVRCFEVGHQNCNNIVSESKGWIFREKSFLHSCWKGENAPTCPVIKAKNSDI
jgi:hypothetical protein